MPSTSWRYWRYSLPLLTVLLALLLLIAIPLKGAGGESSPPPGKQGAAWKEVDRLISEHKFQEALKGVEKIRRKAIQEKDEEEWARALIQEVQLRVGLHGYETSVRFLKEQPWPQALIPRTALDLYYVYALITYVQAYSWEINQRERVEAKGPVDLKAWTREQILAEAQRAFEEIWKVREELGNQPVSRMAEYLSPNNYPPGVRGTLRDAMSYLRVQLLADTSWWRPEHANEVYQLDLGKLIRGDVGEVKLDDPATHPLIKISEILADLELWHGRNGRRDAALEARLERLRRLNASFTSLEDRVRIRQDLEEHLPAFRDSSWWAMGMATLAEFIQAEGQPWNHLVRARSIAEEGWKAYPDSVGGQRCLHIIKAIEAPDFHLAGMAGDGPNKRSIQVTHKNLPVLYFRAYPIDLVRRIETARDYNLFPHGQELQQRMAEKPPIAWTTELPATPDYQSHRTYVVPPLKGTGFYVILASADRNFATQHNRVLAVYTAISDLVLVTRPDEAGGGVEVTVLSGATGKPVEGAEVSLYRYDWNVGHHRVDARTSDRNGVVRFAYEARKQSHSHFLLAKKGADMALDANYISFSQPYEPGETTASLVYTDRSIYRPLQKVFWKVIAYRGRGDQARYRTLPATELTVRLMDANNQKVEEKAVSTNSFGSAAGEFSIPSGRLLGEWRIESSLGGQAIVHVEEYKRPTFEVSFKDPQAPLRLNRPASLTGEARYYFGLPVVTGAVKWQVTRAPVYPWWWGWWGWGGNTQPQVIAAGTASLKEDGTFTLTFTPQADEKQSKDVTYRYEVSTDVTDEGGETRSASRTFRLGFVSVEAAIRSDTAFLRAGTPGEMTVFRSDLNGTPRPGKGSWHLVTLQQPEKTLLPVDQPLPDRQEDTTQSEPYRTPGDSLRPRWDPGYSPEAVLHQWRDGKELGNGDLAHDEKGQAKISLPDLPPGAYRLRYETIDDFGAPYTTVKEFIVADPKLPLALPAILTAESSSVPVGGTARFLVHSGLPGQVMTFDIYRAGKRVERRHLTAGSDPSLIEIPVTEAQRGGFGVTLTVLRDHQFMNYSQSVFVPWDDRELKVSFATFRDKMRPGSKELWRVVVKGPAGANVEAGTAELLAYMYDRSLDIFAPHNPPSPLSLYPYRGGTGWLRSNLGSAAWQWVVSHDYPLIPGYPSLIGDRLKVLSGYGIGGMGRRRYRGEAMDGMPTTEADEVMAMQAPGAPPAEEREAVPMSKALPQPTPAGTLKDREASTGAAPAQQPQVTLRADFSETAFWRPQLLADADGSATIEFTVPDSVTSWNVWVHAVTRDLKGGSLKKETKTVKELMVRPYVPRFLREGDQAALKVVVNNASDHPMQGQVTFDIVDPDTGKSLLAAFGLKGPAAVPKAVTIAPGGGANVTFPITAPRKVGTVAFKVIAVAGDLSDGELRPLPVLPGRLHLAQSRFVTLRDRDRRTMTFEDLAQEKDPTRVNESLIVTLDAQLFYTVLQALPYLVNYPYECTEQILNRFVSTGILSSVYKDYPAVAAMAKEFSKRETQFETWDALDPNRKMTLEESPWLETAQGGKDPGYDLIKVLDPRIANAEREASLAKLRKAQTSLGAFPWWPGGPPSPYMTLYIMHGFAKAVEFGVDVPKDMVQRGWAYLARHFREDYARQMIAHDCCWEFLTFLNYVASSYPDPSWTGNALTPQERKMILDHSFRHWKHHSPYLKGYLALTLKRMGRPKDAQLVFDSVMDSSKTTQDEGTFWAQEDRSWLWYNDTIESHAYALRTLTELMPNDARRHGLVQWLLINKKLNHWKSTRATAEVIYSLVHYLKKEGALGIREDATVTVGPRKVSFTFEPDRYTGKNNRVVIPGEQVDPETSSTVVVEKQSKGFVFASATWHFSTEKLPEVERGNFLGVSRRYYKREQTKSGAVLKPLEEGVPLQPGDEVEVHLSLRSKHAAEYIHLRDPRAAGMEPASTVSRFKWDLGIGWYEEIRDSGTNFFFEWLPVGEYTFKYRLRVNMAGTFRVGPATVQSMYAPEFTAYSAGVVLKVAAGK